MYLVDQNDEIIAKAKYEFSSLPQQKSWRRLKYAKVNQNQKYFATYWRYSDNILFWKNKKKINRMRTKRGIDSLVLEDSLMALSLGYNLYIYYNKNRLITKTQKIKFIKQTKFTIQKQIIFKNSETVEIYDFIRKSLTICHNSNINNLYEYCPIKDIILIPSGDEFTSFISVWGVKENKIIQDVFTGWLKQCRIKMAKSEKYKNIKLHHISLHGPKDTMDTLVYVFIVMVTKLLVQERQKILNHIFNIRFYKLKMVKYWTVNYKNEWMLNQQIYSRH